MSLQYSWNIFPTNDGFYNREFVKLYCQQLWTIIMWQMNINNCINQNKYKNTAKTTTVVLVNFILKINNQDVNTHEKEDLNSNNIQAFKVHWHENIYALNNVQTVMISICSPYWCEHMAELCFIFLYKYSTHGPGPHNEMYYWTQKY